MAGNLFLDNIIEEPSSKDTPLGLGSQRTPLKKSSGIATWNFDLSTPEGEKEAATNNQNWFDAIDSTDSTSINAATTEETEVDRPASTKANGTRKTSGSNNSLQSLLSFISQGEGGYESSNRGTLRGKIVGSSSSTTRDGKKLSNMTLKEIKKYQAIKSFDNPDKLFAVGNAQFNPETFIMTAKGLDLPDDTVFSSKTQDKMGMWLITNKRPELGKYLSGDSGVTLEKAHMELAKEFASVPVPYGKKKGNSYYGRGNKSQFSVQEVQDVLSAIANAARGSE